MGELNLPVCEACEGRGGWWNEDYNGFNDCRLCRGAGVDLSAAQVGEPKTQTETAVQAELAALRAEVAELRAEAAFKPMVRHRKRGTSYQLVGRLRFNTIHDWKVLRDEDELMLYRGEDGGWEARPVDEFTAERWELLPGGEALLDETPPLAMQVRDAESHSESHKSGPTAGGVRSPEKISGEINGLGGAGDAV